MKILTNFKHFFVMFFAIFFISEGIASSMLSHKERILNKQYSEFLEENKQLIASINEWRRSYIKELDTPNVQSIIRLGDGSGISDKQTEEKLNAVADCILLIGEKLENFNVTWLFLSKFYVHKIEIGDKVYSEVGIPSIIFSILGTKEERKLSCTMDIPTFLKNFYEVIDSSAIKYEVEVFY